MRFSLCILALICAGTVAIAADPPTFVGTWNTTYGTMTLTENGNTLSGTYGGKNGISGTVKDGKYTFKYIEPGVIGEGYFELSPDGQSFAGKWRPNGSANWSNWTGKRPQVIGPKAVVPGGGPGVEPPDEPKPVVYKYGNLPKGLPTYFTAGDTDKDGQIGLYEWVQLYGNGEAALAEFKKLDLNADGLLTAEEYLRAKKSANAPTPPTTPSTSDRVSSAPKTDDKGPDPKRVMDDKK